MRVLVCLFVFASASTAAADPVCGDGNLAAICDGARVSVTAGPNPLDAPIIDANTSYAVAGFAANKRNFVVYEPTDSGVYSLYLGGALVTAKFCEESPICAGPAPKGCMHTVASYALTAGERYEIELGPIASGARVLLHLKAPADEERVAINASSPRAWAWAPASMRFASTSRRHIRLHRDTRGSRTP